MAEKWTLPVIVEDWLKSHNYDGLWCFLGEDENCGCGLADLMPCAQNNGSPDVSECEAAYKYEKGGYGPNRELRSRIAAVEANVNRVLEKVNGGD